MIRWLVQMALAGLLLAGAGVYMLRFAPPAAVESVRVVKASNMPELRVLDRPDYYVVVLTHDGDKLQLPTYEDRPMGNGLIWTLPQPPPLDRIAEVQLFDANVISDTMLDRVIVSGAMLTGPLVLKGEKFEFTLSPVHSDHRLVAWIVGGVAGAWLLVALIGVVRRQAIAPRMAASDAAAGEGR